MGIDLGSIFFKYNRGIKGYREDLPQLVHVWLIAMEMPGNPYVSKAFFHLF